MIRFIDGFDHYATVDLPKKWTFVNTSGGTTSPSVGSYGRFSSQGCRFSSNYQYITKVLGAASTYILGFAFSPTTFPTSARTIAAFRDNGSSQVELNFNIDGTLSVTRNGTAITGGTSVSTLSAGVFVFIEWKVTITSSSSGSDNIVRVAGVPVITLPSSSNTKATTNSTVDTLLLGSVASGSGYAFDFDDLYVLDTTGSSNNTFIGDQRVEVIRPSGAGTHTDFSYSGGASNYQSVNESSQDGDTSYVYSATLNNQDTYAMGDLSTPPYSVAAVQVVLVSRKDDAGTRLAAAAIRTGGVDYQGTRLE